MMMCLGLFVFGLDTAAYQELQRQTSWKHPSHARVGTRDARQFTGVGEDSVTLSGWIAPELTGTGLSVDILRAMGDTGKAWILVEGTGRIYGTYVIESLSEGKTIFKKNGEAQRIEFSLQLARTDEGVLGVLDDISNLGSMSQLADMMGLTAAADLARDAVGAVQGIAGRLP